MTVTGTVVDYNTNNAVPGATLIATNQEGTIIGTATTGNDGKFSMDGDGLSDVYAMVQVMADGYQTQTMRVASANGAEIPLPRTGDMLGAVTLTVKKNKTQILIWLAVGVVVAVIYFKFLKGKIKI